VSKALRIIGICALLLAVALAGGLGVFVPADNALASLRFNFTNRAPSGEIVLVEIDGQSLASVGVWPWPRSVHGAMLDRLMEAGASDVVFDVDFSAASTEGEDAQFEAALERAGGYAFLAVFRQLSGNQIILSYPLERFAQYATAVLVNVETDSGGLLRKVPAALARNGSIIPSVALALGQPQGAQPATIEIDFGIDLNRVDRISAIDLLEGKINPGRIVDRQVVIGATAIELRDFFPVPRFGIISGPMAQIAAAETVKANRSLQAYGLWPAAGLLAILGLASLVWGSALSPRWQAATAVAIALGVEAVAWLVLGQWAISFSTAPIHAGLAGLVIVAFLDERALRYRQHQQVKAQRAAMQHMLSQVVTDSFNGILVVDGKGVVVAASDAAGSILRRKEKLIGQKVAAVLPAELMDWLAPGVSGAHECVCQIGSLLRILEVVATRSRLDPDGTGNEIEVLSITFKDITEERRQAEQLSYLASHDALTGALSRYALENHITQQLGSAPAVTAVLVRMNRLRNVSATLGHDVADTVLCEVHERLEKQLGTSVGRLGSDLFAFSWPFAVSETELGHELGRLGDLLEEPYELDDHTVVLGTWFGVSSTRTAPGSASDLLQQAELAVRAAAASTTRFAVYTVADGEKTRARQALDIAMRRALRDGEYFLLYQPQIDLASGAMMGVEALVRWQDPKLGMVSPAQFIPLAEETGLIVALGEWVMRTACAQAASWDWKGRLSVNVSAIQFKLADVVRLVEEATAQSGFPAHRLDIEITESLYVGNDSAVIAALEQLRAMGCKIAIDDFGTGYSSLSYLSALPADKIKVDQSFVRSLPDAGSAAIVETIVAMADRMGLSVIAEGVETAEQRDYLRGLGCPVGQGYLFSRPVRAEELGLVPLPIAV
jgi:diguanylate cyclase (GGDEF)-like protein